MRKPSEVLQIALQHPHYLNFEVAIPNLWLCSCIGDYKFHNAITDEEYTAACSAVHKSLDGYVFLKSFMAHKGILAFETPYESEEYRSAAHAHWNALIASLQAQGL